MTMATHRRTWQRAESGLAKLFGCRRRVLSGSANREDLDGDDGTHPRLWLESKFRESWSVWSLFRRVKAVAKKKSGKTAVLGLREKGKAGCLLVVHEDDFSRVAAEYLAAMGDEELTAFERDVRVRRAEIGRREGEVS
jgi:hypothetical protein